MVKIWNVITRRTKMVPHTAAIATCGTCGRSWDDSIGTSLTPAPSGRCPFEYTRSHNSGSRQPRLFTIPPLTKQELEAVEWAVGQFAGGDSDDCGGSDSRYRAMQSAHRKIPPARHTPRDYHKKRQPTQPFNR